VRRSLPGPLEVTYEAGSTGFALAGFLAGRAVLCTVAGPRSCNGPRGPGQDRRVDRTTGLPASGGA
jgi:hypothetical protein